MTHQARRLLPNGTYEVMYGSSGPTPSWLDAIGVIISLALIVFLVPLVVACSPLLLGLCVCETWLDEPPVIDFYEWNRASNAEQGARFNWSRPGGN